MYSQYDVTEDAEAQVRKCFVLLSRVSLCVSQATYMPKNCAMLLAQWRPSHELHFVVLSSLHCLFTAVKVLKLCTSFNSSIRTLVEQS